MIAPSILLALLLAAPAGAAVDAENPRPPAPVEETPSPSFARPQSPPPVPEELWNPVRVRHTAIYWVGGFATPVGVAGLEAVHRIGQWFELAGGLGIGFAAAGSEPHAPLWHVLQWAAMPRLRLGDDHGAFTAGAGISGGNYANISFFCDGDCSNNTYPVSYFLWSNVELGGEWWWSSGFAMRLFGGFAHGWCVSDTCVHAVTNLPYLGWAFGYAF
jgi:hypothetical protein